MTDEEPEIPKKEVDQFVEEVKSRYADDAVFGGISLWSASYYALMKIRQARQEVEAQMQELLERYGQHDEYDCAKECQRRSCHTKPTDPITPCTCGFTEALRHHGKTP